MSRPRIRLGLRRRHRRGMWTTIGLERQNNPKLQQAERDAFISLIAQKLERPPIFGRWNGYNLRRALFRETVPVPLPLPISPAWPRRQSSSTPGFHCLRRLTSPEGALIWSAGLPSFAGWFLPTTGPCCWSTTPIIPMQIADISLRLGYRNIGGFLSGGMLAWHMAGREANRLRRSRCSRCCSLPRVGEGEPWILDVRSGASWSTLASSPGPSYPCDRLPGGMDRCQDRRRSPFSAEAASVR